ncbi:Fe-S protein [Paenibacillus sp. NPDC057967]|uniref:Fe-S protein n=1 Tax=Paenibacillus sp. NPDC057967 TaxID=3346293 RepID=UPI0036DE8417
MIDAETRRKHIRWNIQQNPSTIIIHGTRRIRSGGGFEDVKENIGPLTGRIFAASNSPASKIESERSVRQEITDSYAILFDDTAVLCSGPDMEQKFEAEPYGRFRITSVNPHIVQGELCGYTCRLERVK